MLMKTAKSLLALVGVAVSLGWFGVASAQDDQQQPASGADAAAAPAESSPEGTAAEAPAAPVKPKPAEIMPLAHSGLLLDIVNTGERLIAVGDHGDIVASVTGKDEDWAQAD